MHDLSRSGGMVFVAVFVADADAGVGQEIFDEVHGDSLGERRFFSGPLRSFTFSECW